MILNRIGWKWIGLSDYPSAVMLLNPAVQLVLNKKEPAGCSIYWNTHGGPVRAPGSQPVSILRNG